jgi:branched-chain amino acid transport system ATP-binding protein
LLLVSNVTAGYSRVPVINEINLTVGEIERVAVVGPNGAGKTTLLRVISNMIRPFSGNVSMEGIGLSGLSSRTAARRGLMHVPEGRRLFAGMTVRENLVLGHFVGQRSNIDAEIEAVLRYFPELIPKLKHRSGTLSGGQQQMLAIARGLISRPKLLLIDEPSVGLAPVIIDRLIQILRDLHGEWFKALLLVEQNASVALSVADRVYVMNQGRVVMESRSDEIDHDRLITGYLGLPRMDA